MKLRKILCGVLVILTALTACDKPIEDKMDRKLGYNYNDYEENLLNSSAKQKMLQPKKQQPIVPKLSQIITKPKTQTVANDKLVSINITEEVSIKDVLIELARSADIDIEMDKNITGGIIFKAKDRPFMEVIDRIADLADLRYETVNGILRITKDTPYFVNYPLDFLNIIRNSKSTASVNTSLGGSGGSSGGGGSTGGGSTGGGSTGGGSSGGGSSTGGGSSSGGGTTSLNSGSSTALDASYSGDLWSQIQSDLNQIISGGVVQQAPDAAGGIAIRAANSYVLFNKQAGIITAFANMKEHRSLANYLNRVRRSATSQVLIEAKFVEVTLDDKYRTGINWNRIDPTKIGLSGSFQSATSGLAGEGITDIFKFGRFTKTGTNLNTNSDLEALVNLVQVFGTTRTLSSPRLSAINNQQAVLSFVRNEVFFTLEADTTTATTTTGTTSTSTPVKTFTSTIQTVPIGVILSLQPSINENTNEVTMNIRPTISKVVGTVSDPAVALNSPDVDVSSQIPIVDVKELDSIMKIKSGDVMVIGGLMEERSSSVDSGMPGLIGIPYFGHLFKSVSKTTEIVQTLIFIRATIAPNDFMFEPDKDYYNKFFKERDPLPFNLIESSL